MKASITRRQFISGMAAASGCLALSQFKFAYAGNTSVLKVRLKRDLQIIDPGYMIGGQESAAQYALFPRLTELSFSGKTVGWKPSVYMEKIELRDDLHIDFQLKKGFQWTNGYGELTAEDVKYSLERMKSSDYGSQFDAIKAVKVIDTYSGTIVLNFAYGPLFIESLSMGVGSIVCKAAVDKMPEKKFALDVPASCGPYVIKEHIPKQQAIFVRNPDWTGPKPDFDEIRCIIVPEANAAELAFEAGELDLTRIESNRIPPYKKKPIPNSKLKIAGYLNHAWIGMNTEHPKLKDIVLRQAIRAAINTNAIRKVVYKDVVEPAYGIVPPGLIGRRENCSYSFDPKNAKALIKKAGVKNLELKLSVLAKNRQQMLAAQIIQSNLKDVGIKVKLNPLDSGPYWSLGREKKGDAWKDSQIWIMAFGGTVDPSGYFQYFIKSQVGNWNWERWSSEEFDKLYKQGIAESNSKKRHAIYVRMQEIMEDTSAYVWLHHEPEAFVYRDTMSVDIDPEGSFLFPSTQKI
ncbi:MAG: hypothetical protein D3926_01440 [Desulfobacteraceae bacterium]|nr:MAG: hypothetical protein D3926_01440 [Desulfobacteraceae bacterium]